MDACTKRGRLVDGAVWLMHEFISVYIVPPGAGNWGHGS